MSEKLTTAGKDAIRSTWYDFNQDIKANGIAFYVSLFTKHPDYLPLFKKFKGNTLDELKRSSVLTSHANLVMKQINDIVENLDHTEELVKFMEQIVNDHYPREIRYYHYESLFEVLLGVFGAAVGSSWSDEARTAWRAAFDILLGVAKARLDALSTQ